MINLANNYNFMLKKFPYLVLWLSCDYFLFQGQKIIFSQKLTNTHYHNNNLIWCTVSHWVDEVIPSDHPRRVASRVIQGHGLIHKTWYCTPYQVTIMIICLLYAFFLTLFWFYNLFWSLILINCGNICHSVTFLDITSSCFPSLVPCLKFTLCNVAAKTGNWR